MEKTAGVQEPLCFHQPTRPKQADSKCEAGLEDDAQASRCFLLPDLQPATHRTRLSWVAPDAVVQRAMRHISPETKRTYQLGLVHQVREQLERVNEKSYEGTEPLQFRDTAARTKNI